MYHIVDPCELAGPVGGTVCHVATSMKCTPTESRLRLGPLESCICPKCGERIPHLSHVPCQNEKCPNSGEEMLCNDSLIINAWIIGTAVNVVAIVVSYNFDFPTGYTLVLLHAILALTVSLVVPARRLKEKAERV